VVVANQPRLQLPTSHKNIHSRYLGIGTYVELVVSIATPGELESN